MDNNEPKIENNVEHAQEPVVEQTPVEPVVEEPTEPVVEQAPIDAPAMPEPTVQPAEQAPVQEPIEQPDRPPLNMQKINKPPKKKLDKKTKTIIEAIILAIVLALIIAAGLYLYRITGPKIVPKLDTNSFVDGGNCGVNYIGWNSDTSEDTTEGLYTSYESLPSRIKDYAPASKFDFDNNSYYLFKVRVGEWMKNLTPISRTDVMGTAYVSMGYNIDESHCVSSIYDSLNYVCYLAKTSKTSPIKKVEITGTKEMNGKNCPPNSHNVWKPLIYIYPEKEMDVSIKLGNSHLITTSYPKYVDGWNVKASPDGNLEYNGKNYYGLYWEGENYNSYESDEGFIVKGEDTSKFFEEKLSLLGLSEKEANEFIIYWLPKMEHNKYNYIRFDTLENINSYMPLEISPKPETLIRVYMMYKPLDNYKEVKEQTLTKVERKGYTVVEWGGSEIK